MPDDSPKLDRELRKSHALLQKIEPSYESMGVFLTSNSAERIFSVQ
jgi:hypothetical protein